MRYIAFLVAFSVFAAGPVVSNLQIDDITQTTARVTFNTSAVGPSSTLQTTMTSTAPTSGGTITLADASLFPTAGTVKIGTENIAYKGKSLNVLTLLSDPARGRDSTTAAAHAINDAVQQVENEYRVCYKEPAGVYDDRKSASHIGYGLVKPQVNFHTTRISGLNPNTTYTYKVRTRAMAYVGNATTDPFVPISCTAVLGANDTETAEATFTTQAATDVNPVPPASISFSLASMPTTTGTTYNVVAGDCNNVTTGLQASINAAAAADANLNHVINIPAGTICTGRYKLTNKTGVNSGTGTGGGSGWITIRTATSDALLPPMSVRINRTYVNAGLLPRLEADQTTASTIYLEDYVTGYWLMGLDIGFDTTTDVLLRSAYAIPIYLRDTTETGTFVARQPKRIVIDRNVIGGMWNNAYWTKGCIFYRGGDIAIINNYCHNINVAPSLESGGLQSDEGTGPYLLHNNFVEGGTENIFFGDNGAGDNTWIPKDITITRNYAIKPVSWKGNDASFTSQTQFTPTAVSVTNPIQFTFATVHNIRVGAGAGADGLNYAPTQVVVSGATAPCAALNGTWNATRVTKFIISVPFDGLTTNCSAQASITVSYGQGAQMKNLMEFKTGVRALVRGNYLTNSWSGNPNIVTTPQGGCAVLFTTRGPFTYGGWPTSLAGAATSHPQYNRVVQSIDLQWNLIRNTACGFSMSGFDDTSMSGAAGKYRVENNLVYGIDATTWADANSTGNSGYAEALRASNGVENLQIRHNTFWGDYTYPLYSRYAYMSGLFMDSNIFRWGWNGIAGGFTVENGSYTGQSGGNGLGGRRFDPSCAASIQYPPWNQFGSENYSFSRNIIVADSRYTPGDALGYASGRGRFGVACNNPDDADITNNYWAVAGLGYDTRVGWTDRTNGNFRLAASSLYKRGTTRTAALVTGTDAQLAGQGAAHDGADIGVPSQDQLEAEIGIRSTPIITPGSTQAVFAYVAPDGASCTIDASTSSTFATITTRSTDSGGPRARVNTIGGLTASTAYNYRLDCAGAGYTGPTTGTFTTTAAGSATTLPVALKPGVTVDNALIDYGATSALGFSVGGAVGNCTAGCTLNVPATSRQALYYRVTYRNAANATIVQGPVVSVIP